VVWRAGHDRAHTGHHTKNGPSFADSQVDCSLFHAAECAMGGILICMMGFGRLVSE
jgi:hypothetical protein